jgi:DNA-binding response OmpR family regulator
MDAQPPVVVVEDAALLCSLIREILTLEGYTSMGLPHLYRLESTHPRPALFLIDIMLPDGNGVDVARQVRLDGYAETPIIAMSASDAVLARATVSGVFDETLSKPFDIAHLLERIKHYVGQIEIEHCP